MGPNGGATGLFSSWSQPIPATCDCDLRWPTRLFILLATKSGLPCRANVTVARSDVCLNGGSFIDYQRSPIARVRCSCPSGFVGERCQVAAVPSRTTRVLPSLPTPTRISVPAGRAAVVVVPWLVAPVRFKNTVRLV